jgi:hypothetical protein
MAGEDHYLLVMIAAANTEASARPKYDRLKLFATAAAIIIGLMVVIKFFN